MFVEKCFLCVLLALKRLDSIMKLDQKSKIKKSGTIVDDGEAAQGAATCLVSISFAREPWQGVSSS